MDGLTSFLDQGYLNGMGQEPGTSAEAAQAAEPDLKTPEGDPMPVAVAEEPTYLGLTRTQWVVLLAAAGLTYMLMRRKK